MNTHTVTFSPDGVARCLWTDAVPLRALGRLELQRASTVEFNHSRQVWEVRLAAHPGSVAFAHPSRASCLVWEQHHLGRVLEHS